MLIEVTSPFRDGARSTWPPPPPTNRRPPSIPHHLAPQHLSSWQQNHQNRLDKSMVAKWLANKGDAWIWLGLWMWRCLYRILGTCMREMNIHNEAPVTHFPSKHEKQITHKIIDISIFCASRTLSVCVCACTSCFRTFLSTWFFFIHILFGSVLFSSFRIAPSFWLNLKCSPAAATWRIRDASERIKLS